MRMAAPRRVDDASSAASTIVAAIACLSRLAGHAVGDHSACEKPQNSGMSDSVQHHETGAKGAFFIAGADGEHIATMSYSRANAMLVVIDHTDVHPSLAGQGVGRQLLNALVDWARSTGTKVVPLCPFASAQFKKDASIHDVLM
jgi:uncharacterized protein